MLTVKELSENQKNGSIFVAPKKAFKQKQRKGRISEVWTFFDLVGMELDGKKHMTNFAMCKRCATYIQFNHSATTQLTRHKCEKYDRTQTLCTSFSQERSCPGPGHSKQDNLPAKVTQEDIMKVREGCAKFIALDIRPFFAVEGEGFKALLKSIIEICNKYDNLNENDIVRLLPGRLTMARYIEKIEANVKAIMKTDFQKAIDCSGGFSCTADEYTDCYKSNTYLGITASLNFVENGKIQRKSYVVYLNKVPNKTGSALITAAKDCFADLGVNENQMNNNIVWVTDRGSNIKNAFKDAKRLNCFAHIINNIVREMADNEVTVKKMINDALTLVRYMKTSSIDCNELTKSLKKHVETRWNYTYIMFESIEFNYTDIFRLLSEKEKSPGNREKKLVTKLTCLSSSDLAEICTFLKEFHEISLELEGDKYATIHLVWPAYNRIQEQLKEKATDSHFIKNMKELGRSYMSDGAEDIEPQMEHKIAVFLHPLLKGADICGETEWNTIIERVKELVQNTSSSTETDENHNVDIDNQNRVTSATEVHKRAGILNHFLNNSSRSAQATKVDRSEVEKYMEFPVELVNNNYFPTNHHRINSLFLYCSFV